MQTQTVPRTQRSGTEQTPNRLEARILADAFRRAQRATTRPQTDSYLVNLYRRIESGRVRLLDHLLLFARNWFARGASQEAVEGLGHAYIAIVRSWYGGESTPDLATLVRNETAFQGSADVKQLELMVSNPTPQNIAEAEERLSVHALHLNALLHALRQLRYAQSRAA